jgi:hypothetical protein
MIPTPPHPTPPPLQYADLGEMDAKLEAERAAHRASGAVAAKH